MNSPLKSKPILGIFRADSAPATLGNVLNFLNELKYASQLLLKEKVGIALVGNNLPAYVSEICTNNTLQVEISCFTNHEKLLQFLTVSDYLCVPEGSEKSSLSTAFYDYDCIERIEKLYGQSQLRPHFLEMKPKVEHFAKELIRKKIGSEEYLSLHLKQINHAKNESDANLAIWKKVIIHFKKIRPKLKFLIVGHDGLSSEIESLANVVCAKSFEGLSLLEHLDFIHQSQGFLGMSSGLCQMALFSNKPYLIFKNPDHHYDEMAQILKKNKVFSFANDSQHLYQEYESFDRIVQFIDQVKL